jgi:hypothetical protein
LNKLHFLCFITEGEVSQIQFGNSGEILCIQVIGSLYINLEKGKQSYDNTE